MGYDSNFNLSILRCRDKKEGRNIIRDIEEQSGQVFDDVSADSASIYDAHWYDAVDDIAAVARKYPSAIIELEREGENRDDNERTRFHGEKRETVTLVQRWPPFKEIVPKKQTHVATVIEVDGNGDVFTAVYIGDDPGKVAGDVYAHLDTERTERRLTFDYNRAVIYDAVRYGNDVSSPERIEVIDADITFHIATAVR